MKKPYTTFLSLGGMFLILSMAYGLDILTDSLKQLAMSQFAVPFSWLLPTTILEIVFVCLLLVWLGFVYNKDDDHLYSPLIFILVGLGLLFYNYVIIVSDMPLPILMNIIPKSLSSFASAFVAVVGFQRLVFRRTKSLS